MKEKRILTGLFLLLFPFCWLAIAALHSEPLHGADLNQVNLQIGGMT